MKMLMPWLAGLFLAVIVFFVQESRIDALENQLAEARRSSGDPENHTDAAPVTLRPSSSDAATSIQSSSRDDSPTTRDVSSSESFGKALAELMENEAGQAMIKQQLEMALPMIYGDFIKKLGLKPEEEKYFKSLLVDHISGQQSLGMKWMQSKGEEKKAISKQIEDFRKLSLEAIDKFLNDEEDAADFRQYQEELPERQTLPGLRGVLGEDKALSQESEEKLVDLLYQSRVNSGEGKFNEDEIWSSIDRDGGLNGVKDRWQATDELIFEGLPDILTEEQLSSFIDYWKNLRKMQEMQYQMAHQMFKNSNQEGP